MTLTDSANGRSKLIARSIAIATLITIGVFSVQQSLGNVLRSRNPQLAYRLAPGDARVASTWSSVTFGLGQDADKRSAAIIAARSALMRDSTVVSAVSTLAFDADLRGDHGRALKLVNYAERLSRRDLKTQIYLIEDAVTRGDIRGALKHYDIALRASDKTSALMFPVLRESIADPDLREAMVHTLQRRPPWSDLFLYDLVNKGPDFEATAQTLVDLRHSGVKIPENADNVLMTRLVERSQIELAWNYFRSLNPKADRNGLRNGAFQADGGSATPFDWVMFNTAEVSVAVNRDSSRNFLSYRVAPTLGATAARQLLVLSPGSYSIVGKATRIAEATGKGPYWRLVCIDGRSAGTVDIPASPDQGMAFRGTVTVPDGCATQLLELVIRPSDAVGGATGEIDQVTIVRSLER